MVLAKSKRVAERLLESCRKYLEGWLKLKMNTEKSKVTSIFAKKKVKFLGFCLGKNGHGIYIRVHRKSLAKAKEKLKLLTKRKHFAKPAAFSRAAYARGSRRLWIEVL